MFCSFIVTIIYRYQQKQNIYFKELEALKVTHETDLLKARLEMQEYTFQHVSREIHDNIGQKLSLAKLYLNTITDSIINPRPIQVDNSVGIIAEVIIDLSDIARSMSSEIILDKGLVNGVEFEVAQLQKSGIYEIDLVISGNPIFFDFKKEIIVFRIIQESLHNIMKHAEASEINISLHYSANQLLLSITDNGKGFVKDAKKHGIGLTNIRRRVSLLEGELSINSSKDGTQLITTLPIKQINNDENDPFSR
ncbi:MAG: sensor histidine kinase [Ferruginibacter sp.]|nr:sensor histidine kinase [Ferruginibacter sp.]